MQKSISCAPLPPNEISQVKYEIQAQFSSKYSSETRWVTVCKGLVLDEARAGAKRWDLPTRIIATSSDGRTVVVAS